MSEKSISERGKETLKWIQKEQKLNGLGMVESNKIPDQDALRFLLRKSDVFEPQQGMIKSLVEPESEESVEFPDHKPWIWRKPKPKKKGDAPEPYEFLAYPDWNILPATVAAALRDMGFGSTPYLFGSYSYRKIGGGALRRKMKGNYSKEVLLEELKLTKTEAELAEIKQKINDVIAEKTNKAKQISEVQVCSGIIYYPKDRSFSLQENKKQA